MECKQRVFWKIQYFISENLLFWKYWTFWLTGGTYILKITGSAAVWRCGYEFLCRCTDASWKRGERSLCLILSEDCCCLTRVSLLLSWSGQLGKYCDISCCSVWDCSLLAEPIQVLNLHFKVLLCNDQENLFFLLFLLWTYLYKRDFWFTRFS